jgi:hypothetical protein
VCKCDLRPGGGSILGLPWRTKGKNEMAMQSRSAVLRQEIESSLASRIAFRKLQAARYHRQRVEEFIDAQRKEMIEMEARSRPKEHELKITSALVRVRPSCGNVRTACCWRIVRGGWLVMASLSLSSII